MPGRAELRERSERVPRSAHATPLARVYTYESASERSRNSARSCLPLARVYTYAFLRLIYPWNLVLVLARLMDLRVPSRE